MNKTIIGLIVVTLLVIAGTVAIVMTSTQREAGTPPTADGSTSNVSSNTPSSGEEFEDGEYTANGSYLTPGGNESIDVTIQLSDNVITNASVTQNAVSNEAKEFQAKFASGFEAEVVGKRIDEISLSRVAGSSLTPGGFNSAIDNIEEQAKA